MSAERPYRVVQIYKLPHEDYPTANDALEEARARRPGCACRWVGLSPSGKHWRVEELEPST